MIKVISEEVEIVPKNCGSSICIGTILLTRDCNFRTNSIKNTIDELWKL